MARRLFRAKQITLSPPHTAGISLKVIIRAVPIIRASLRLSDGENLDKNRLKNKNLPCEVGKTQLKEMQNWNTDLISRCSLALPISHHFRGFLRSNLDRKWTSPYLFIHTELPGLSSHILAFCLSCGVVSDFVDIHKRRKLDLRLCVCVCVFVFSRERLGSRARKEAKVTRESRWVMKSAWIYISYSHETGRVFWSDYVSNYRNKSHPL